VVIAATNTLSANAQIVVAHFMAQNAFSYSQDDWTNDINTAKATGLDGFALNIALPDYEVDRVATAFVGEFFYIFCVGLRGSSAGALISC